MPQRRITVPPHFNQQHWSNIEHADDSLFAGLAV